MRAESTGPLLTMTGITKRYPGCLANDRVSLTIGRNQIHALLGENGAGKSTLVKIAYGVLRPDAGEITWQGERVTIADPAHARRLGIGMVFQHFSLFEALSVADNISLALNDPADRVGLRDRIVAVSTEYGLPVDPDRSVHDLSVGERQRIEIVRCLLQNPKLLIMDEPTSVLTPQEVERLFTTLRRLSREGCSILYISHKLEEVRTLCEAATVMRMGRVVATCTPAAHTARELAEIMMGAELKQPAKNTRAGPEAAPRLVVRRLTIRSPHPFGTDLKQIDMSVAGGEILGVAGIAGNGQTELMDALSGEVLAGKPENILIDGIPAGHMGPHERRKLGGCFVPEERNGHGAVPTMSLSDNAFLSAHLRGSLQRMGVIDARRTTAFANRIIEGFDVRTTGAKAEARSLSGGNLQKFLVGREVLLKPNVLVINQPTWGVDAGAAQSIHAAIVRLAQAGAAVVIISQDLEELFVLCDGIAVLAAGRLSAPAPTSSATVQGIGLLMGGEHAVA
jgi:simple sugar transport system ATP-binding protein